MLFFFASMHKGKVTLLVWIFIKNYSGLTTGVMILNAISIPPCQKLHIARPGRGPSTSPATAAAMLQFSLLNDL